MNYFMLYVDALRQYKRLSDAEFGRALRAVLQYVEDGTETDLPGKESIMYDVLCAQAERDRKSCDKKLAAQRENGSKGGRPRKTHGNPNNPRVFIETQETQEKEKEYIPPYNPPKGEDDEEVLLRLNAKHNEVFDKAKDCGFDVNTATLDRLTDLIASHGAEAVLLALDECVEHNARSLAYLRKVLESRSKPKEESAAIDYGSLYI